MSKLPYDPNYKFEESILEPNIVNIKKLLEQYKDTSIELAAYSLKARV